MCPGLAVLVLKRTAGKLRIADSSLNVPLSDMMQKAFCCSLL